MYESERVIEGTNVTEREMEEIEQDGTMRDDEAELARLRAELEQSLQLQVKLKMSLEAAKRQKQFGKESPEYIRADPLLFTEPPVWIEGPPKSSPCCVVS